MSYCTSVMNWLKAVFLLRSNLFRSLFRVIIIIITYQDGCYLLKNAFVAGIAESFICWPACKNYRQGGIVGGGGRRGGGEGGWGGVPRGKPTRYRDWYHFCLRFFDENSKSERVLISFAILKRPYRKENLAQVVDY